MIAIPVGLLQGDISQGVYEDEDPNDYERQQDMASGTYDYVEADPNEIPGIYTDPYRLNNWPLDDLVTYVGGIYAKEAYSK